MNILGLSCYYHDSAACLIRDGKVVAAAQEERFDREKYSARFPVEAIKYCLEAANITANDIDCISFYEKPYLKFERTLLSHVAGFPLTLRNFVTTMPSWLKERLSLPLMLEDELKYRGKVTFVPHHLAHAASAYLVSPFDEAAIMTFDGVGEKTTTTFGRGKGCDIDILAEIRYPHSLGLLYSIITSYLGFRVFSGEGKVMALAEFGKPRYVEQFRELIETRKDGSFHLNTRYFRFSDRNRMYGKQLVELLGPARAENGPIEARHQDVAASLQAVVEDTILKTARHVHRQTGLTKLCLAGGVFLNVTTNTRLLKETPFKQIFIQPAAGDSGAALGAAAYCAYALSDQPRLFTMKDAYLGSSFTDAAIKRVLLSEGAKFEELSEFDLPRRAAELIARGKVVGWFQNRMEFGPRALGARSILADPRVPDMKDILNHKVKHRESFRPFGVSVLREEVSSFFDWEGDSPYMLFVAPVRPEKRALIPAGLHVNDTSRIQTVARECNPLYHSTIRAFHEFTGVPMVINTSFNDNDEPIVCTPEEAYRCFMKTGMDALVIGSFVLEKT